MSKLKSRKFWVMVLGTIGGLAGVLPPGLAEWLPVVWMVAEGVADVAGARAVSKAVAATVDAYRTVAQK